VNSNSVMVFVTGKVRLLDALVKRMAKDYNRGFGIIRHNSPKVAANDLYAYESKLFL